jgi:Ni,Fe-hydrogenase III small subunit
MLPTRRYEQKKLKLIDRQSIEYLEKMYKEEFEKKIRILLGSCGVFCAISRKKMLISQSIDNRRI